MQRKPIGVDHIEAVTNDFLDILSEKIAEKGNGAFVSIHEGLGAITEEYLELVDAIRESKDTDAFVNLEAFDVMVACIWLIASNRVNNAVHEMIPESQADGEP